MKKSCPLKAGFFMSDGSRFLMEDGGWLISPGINTLALQYQISGHIFMSDGGFYDFFRPLHTIVTIPYIE